MSQPYFRNMWYTLEVLEIGSSSSFTLTTFICLDKKMWIKWHSQIDRRQWVPSRNGSMGWALAGETSVAMGGWWGSPGGQLKISSLFGCIGETAELSRPTYTWECRRNSCCKELTPAGEEEQRPSISETGTWHPSGPDFWGRNNTLRVAAA